MHVFSYLTLKCFSEIKDQTSQNELSSIKTVQCNVFSPLLALLFFPQKKQLFNLTLL